MNFPKVFMAHEEINFPYTSIYFYIVFAEYACFLSFYFFV